MKINPVATAMPHYTRDFQQSAIPRPSLKGDRVTLSDEGKNLQAQTSSETNLLADLGSRFMGGAGADGVITVGEIEAFAQSNVEESDRSFSQIMNQLGIPENTRIEVTTDTEGTIKVSSDLSDADNERLEKALNASEEFGPAFRAASASKGLLRAIERHEAFSEAYAGDPEAAVARYGIGSKQNGHYIFTYRNGESDMVYQELFSLG